MTNTPDLYFINHGIYNFLNNSGIMNEEHNNDVNFLW